MHLYMYVCMYECMYVCMNVCIYIYTHTYQLLQFKHIFLMYIYISLQPSDFMAPSHGRLRQRQAAGAHRGGAQQQPVRAAGIRGHVDLGSGMMI